MAAPMLRILRSNTLSNIMVNFLTYRSCRAVGMRYVSSSSSKLPLCYFDMSIDGEKTGRMVFELRSDLVPTTVENFILLCKGDKGYGYKNSTIHRIMPMLMCQGGDVVCKNGNGGKSSFGYYLKDENFRLKHSEAGILSMEHLNGPHTNNSQFSITFAKQRSLDGHRVAFGKLIEGMDVLKAIEDLGAMCLRPEINVRKVVIEDCGEIVH